MYFANARRPRVRCKLLLAKNVYLSKPLSRPLAGPEYPFPVSPTVLYPIAESSSGTVSIASGIVLFGVFPFPMPCRDGVVPVSIDEHDGAVQWLCAKHLFIDTAVSAFEIRSRFGVVSRWYPPSEVWSYRTLSRLIQTIDGKSRIDTTHDGWFSPVGNSYVSVTSSKVSNVSAHQCCSSHSPSSKDIAKLKRYVTCNRMDGVTCRDRTISSE